MTDWSKLPHDGSIICQVTGKALVGRLDQEFDKVMRARKARFRIIRRLSKELGFTKVGGVTAGPHLRQICDWQVYYPLPKEWHRRPAYPKNQGKRWDDVKAYYDRRKAAVQQLKDEVMERIHAINATVPGNAKCWRLTWRYSSEAKYLVGTLTPMGRCQLAKAVKAHPVPDVNDLLREILKQHNDKELGAERIEQSPNGRGMVLRHPSLELRDAVWYAHFPISQKEAQPQDLSLPPGFKRLKVSQYWAARERAAVAQQEVSA